MIRTGLSIIMVIICIAITALVLFQEGKENGLSALAGQTVNDNTWYGKNRKKSKEAVLKKATAFLIGVFFLVGILLNTGIV